MADLKLYCVVSREALAAMKGNRGKLGAQCGHAFVHALLNGRDAHPEAVRRYLEDQRAYKVVLACDTTAELEELQRLYADLCGTALIKDAGLTVFEEPTVTCLGIGPIDPDLREDRLKALRPLI